LGSPVIAPAAYMPIGVYSIPAGLTPLTTAAKELVTSGAFPVIGRTLLNYL